MCSLCTLSVIILNNLSFHYKNIFAGKSLSAFYSFWKTMLWSCARVEKLHFDDPNFNVKNNHEKNRSCQYFYFVGALCVCREI